MCNLKLKKRGQEAVMLLDLNKRFIQWIYDFSEQTRVPIMSQQFRRWLHLLLRRKSALQYHPSHHQAALILMSNP